MMFFWMFGWLSVRFWNVFFIVWFWFCFVRLWGELLNRILFCVMIMVCEYMVGIFLRMCVEMMIVFFGVMFWMSVCILFFWLGFRLLVGLFRISMAGLWVMVVVRVVWCLKFLDRVLIGWLEVLFRCIWFSVRLVVCVIVVVLNLWVWSLNLMKFLGVIVG